LGFGGGEWTHQKRRGGSAGHRRRVDPRRRGSDGVDMGRSDGGDLGRNGEPTPGGAASIWG
jgi:hypothetical protein